MAPSVRIWVKKQLKLDTLTFRQNQMVQIGSAGLLSVFRRLAAAQGPNDGPAKPLTKGYAIYKTRKGKGNRRNLFFTGQLLSTLKLRTVSDNKAYMAPGADRRQLLRVVPAGSKLKPQKGTVTNRDVARGNQMREPWLVFSPANRRDVILAAQRVLGQIKNQLVKTVGTNG
jgi:hypothetical protein